MLVWNTGIQGYADDEENIEIENEEEIEAEEETIIEEEFEPTISIEGIEEV